jgi:hypothetical protein
VVTIFTTYFKIRKTCEFCLFSVHVLHHFLNKMVTISLNSINWLVFALNMHCVLCETETEFLIIIWMNFRLQGVNYVILKCNLDKISFKQSECTPDKLCWNMYGLSEYKLHILINTMDMKKNFPSMSLRSVTLWVPNLLIFIFKLSAVHTTFTFFFKLKPSASSL